METKNRPSAMEQVVIPILTTSSVYRLLRSRRISAINTTKGKSGGTGFQEIKHGMAESWMKIARLSTHHRLRPQPPSRRLRPSRQPRLRKSQLSLLHQDRPPCPRQAQLSCIMPTPRKNQRRRLGESHAIDAAKESCFGFNYKLHELCVSDVLAMGDPTVANVFKEMQDSIH